MRFLIRSNAWHGVVQSFLILLGFGLLQHTFAIEIVVTNDTSIRNAAAAAAYNLQEWYNGNQTGGEPGKFPYPPYYWWLSGAAWGGMVDYQQYTGDTSWFNVTYDALVSQISPTYNFLPIREKFDEGNDDVAFWAFGAMSAAEYDWPDPPSPYPSWFQVCDNVFNDYVDRWNAANSTCAGGLKWQIFPSSRGYTYKNSVSNGGFFQLAARLWRFTGNVTYYEWAEKVWDWSTDLGFINEDYAVFDGAGEGSNCTVLDTNQWSYNAAIYLMGASVLTNVTAALHQAFSSDDDEAASGQPWLNRTLGLLSHAETEFFSPFSNATDVMYEPVCSLDWSCNVDQVSFKAYLSRWMGQTSILIPQTASRIRTLLETSAEAAARQCASINGDVKCGTRWYMDVWDGTQGVGQALSAMEVMYSLLVR